MGSRSKVSAHLELPRVGSAHCKNCVVSLILALFQLHTTDEDGGVAFEILEVKRTGYTHSL
jgi:hypothetical protein